MSEDLRAGERVIAVCNIGSRLRKFVPQGSQGVVIQGGRQPLIRFRVAEDWFGKLFPHSVELHAGPDQVESLNR